MKFTTFSSVPSLIDDLIDSFAVFFASLIQWKKPITCALNVSPYIPGLLNIRDVGNVRSDLNRVFSVQPIFNFHEWTAENSVVVIGTFDWAFVEKSGAYISANLLRGVFPTNAH